MNARPSHDKSELRRLIDDALVDACGEAEQATAFYTMIEDHLTLPIKTAILGIAVTVERVELNDRDDVVFVCRRGKHRLRVSAADLPDPGSIPEGWEWVEAYSAWLRCEY